MTKKEETIEALKILLKNYIINGRLSKCPLCKIYLDEGCIACPWVKFNYMTCSGYANDKGYQETSFDLRNGKSKKWNKLRKRQIKVWIKKLKKRLL